VCATIPWGVVNAQTKVERLSATDLFTMADRARAAGHVDAAATIYDALAKDPDDQVRAEARFRKGMMLADKHRYREAALAFQALLDEKPDALRVRLELANVLAQLGDEAGARRQLRRAEAGSLPPDVAATVQQFSRALRSTRRFGGSLELALAPDSNINRATDQRTLNTVIAPLTLSRDARAQSGLGVKATGSAFARLPLTSTLDLLPRVSGIANLYRAKQFDDVSAQGLIGLEWRRGGDRWSPSIGASQRWFGGKPYVVSQTAAISWLHPAGQRSQLLIGANASRVDYRLNNLQDGTLINVSASYDRALTQKTGISIGATATRQTARDSGYSTWSEGVTALSWLEAGKSTFVGSVSVTRLDGDKALFLFPKRRQEWLAEASAGVTLRRLAVHGFAPMLRIGYQRNWSTVGLYDFSRLSGDFGVVRAF
jgi:tetratricopeptide (TPR) repeat protein